MNSAKPKINVSITPNNIPSLSSQGRVGFNINLGEIGFRRFLSNLPEGQAQHYEDRANVIKDTIVEVTLPSGFEEGIDLENPLQALEEMSAICRHHRINTTTYILDRVALAVQDAA